MRRKRFRATQREAVLDNEVRSGLGNVVKAEFAMFEKPVLEVQDSASYDVVRTAIQSALSSNAAARFLKQLQAQRLRVRDFETVLAKGLLSQEAIAAYGRLGDLDRGQIRELYLESIEHVAPELRAKHLKAYAYY
jgi:hypothetical protein